MHYSIVYFTLRLLHHNVSRRIALHHFTWVVTRLGSCPSNAKIPGRLPWLADCSHFFSRNPTCTSEISSYIFDVKDRVQLTTFTNRERELINKVENKTRGGVFLTNDEVFRNVLTLSRVFDIFYINPKKRPKVEKAKEKS